jgi:thermostable 8-oxoguanine DNA glycosylase
LRLSASCSYAPIYQGIRARAKKEELEARESLSELLKKHGYKYKNERGYFMSRTKDSIGGTSPIVHPLYEQLFDEGKFNMETRSWDCSRIPEWAVLDFSEQY